MKRAPELRDLSSDHHRNLVFARRLLLAAESGVVDDAWEEVGRRYREELDGHFQAEEAALLPALEVVGEGALVQRTLDEHARMRALATGERTVDNLRAFAELLQAHVRFEERELFRVAQERLDPIALAGVARAVPGA